VIDSCAERLEPSETRTRLGLLRSRPQLSAWRLARLDGGACARSPSIESARVQRDRQPVDSGDDRAVEDVPDELDERGEPRLVVLSVRVLPSRMASKDDPYLPLIDLLNGYFGIVLEGAETR
jgi:hypothetical protein